MKKTIRLTESDLVRLVKKVLEEQFNRDVEYDNYDDESYDGMSNIDSDMDMRNDEITKSQLKDMINHYSEISCDGINQFNELEMYGRVPEWNIIYCLYYKGKSRADLIKKYKSMGMGLLDTKVKPVAEQVSDNGINIQSTNTEAPPKQSNASNIIGKTVTFYPNEALADKAFKLGKSIPQTKNSWIGVIKDIKDVTTYGLELTVDWYDVEKQMIKKQGQYITFDREDGLFKGLPDRNKPYYNTSLKNFLNKTYFNTDFASKQKPLGSIV